MPSQVLTTEANELSTYVVRFTFRDENGDLLVPTSLTWTLTDVLGAVVNSRTKQVVSPTSSVVDILLTGSDLALGTFAGTKRVLTVEGKYTSALGSDLALKDDVTFVIRPLIGVS